MKTRVFITSIFLLGVIFLIALLGRARSTATFGSMPSKVSPTDNHMLSYRLGAYYYPWYYNDFHGRQYLREHLVPQQEPMLGEYNDRDADVIRQHLDWSRYAGVEFWVTSWWGPGGREDVTTLNYIMQHPDLDDFKIAVFYETVGRTNDFADYSNLSPDIIYLPKFRPN